MQNKNFLNVLLATSLLIGAPVWAQEMPDLSDLEKEMVVSDSDTSEINVANKKAVDFPERSSMGTMEMPVLPDVWETPITGPQPYAESVSPNDTPSEQLLGHITPEVFQEMAELERDTAFLKLQIQKETMKNDLENVRSNYRQARLDEIAKREEVIRSRIQWWQEQEKLRQAMEKERAEAEEIKNQKAQAEALKAQKEGEAAAAALERQLTQEEGEDFVPLEEELETPAASYALVDVKGVRGNLIARIRNTDTQEVLSVKVGDVVNDEKVTEIQLEKVVIDRKGKDYVVKFPLPEPKVTEAPAQDDE